MEHFSRERKGICQNEEAVLKLNNTRTEIKITLDGLNSGMEMTEGRVTNLETR